MPSHRPKEKGWCNSESHDAALPWPSGAMHFQHIPWWTQVPWTGEDPLNGYFAPKRNVVAEHYKFRSRAQNTDKLIDAYLTSLRKLAKSCDFGMLEEEMISDQIVEKCSSWKSLQQDLDLAKTIKIPRSAETAVQEVRLLSQDTNENSNLIQIDHMKQQFSCYRCGGMDGHTPAECSAIKSMCNHCKKVGHLQKVCDFQSCHPEERKTLEEERK